MCSRTTLLACMLWATTVFAAGPAEDLMSSLPQSTDHVRIRTPLAAVCADGSTWLFWWQGITIEDFERVTTPGSDFGIFCKLVSRTGKEILSARRIVSPSSIHDVESELVPYPFYLVATPDGNAVLFLQPKRSTASPTRMRVMLVNRRGEVHEGELGFHVYSGQAHIQRVWLTSQGRMWSYTGPDGRLWCLFGGDTENPGQLLQLEVPQGPDWLRHPEGRRYTAFEPEATPEIPHRSLRWMRSRGNLYAAFASAGSDSVIVAFCPPAGQGDFRFGARHPGDTLVVYRYRAQDFTLLDSTTAWCGAVAGSDFPDLILPHALLVKTGTGYIFYLQRAGRVSSYLLDAQGRAQLGQRAAEHPGAIKARNPGMPELAYFGKPNRRPWVANRLGFNGAGMLLHERVVADSIPGRFR